MKYLPLLLILCGGLATGPLSAAPRPTAQALIEHFKMTRIPQEGPWFTLTWRSEETLPRTALPDRYDGPRPAGTAIIGIITRTDFSAMHRLKDRRDVALLRWRPVGIAGTASRRQGSSGGVGPDVLAGQKLQYVVPRGSWQGARPVGDRSDAYTLFGDTLAPGFEYADFEMGYRDELQRIYRVHSAAIARLTRSEFAHRAP